MLAAALRNIYERRYDPRTQIDAELFEEVSRIFDAATDAGFSGSEAGGDFMEQLHTNNAVFAAFKTHRMGRDMAAQLIDENGEVKSYQQFRRDVEPIADHHVEAWLRTEYDTAIKRAHRAAEMRQFMVEADVLPNIRWLPSTAVNPRESHMPFYDHVWPVDDPFWEEHKPGDEWGCQCGWEATDDPVTDNSGLGGRADRTVARPERQSGAHGTTVLRRPSLFPLRLLEVRVQGCAAHALHQPHEGLLPLQKRTQSGAEGGKDADDETAELAEKKSDATSRVSRLSLPAPAVHSSTELKYGTVMCSKSDIRQLVYHAADAESVDVSMKMDRYLDRLRFVRVEEPKHFTGKKQSRGLVEYTVYELEVGKRTFVVKCEARTNRETSEIYEHPYSIYRK